MKNKFVVRVVLMTLVSIMLVLLDSSSASAHAGGAPAASNYRTTLSEIVPSVKGLNLSVKDGGDRMQLANNTGRSVIVVGYQNDPYLRIERNGVFENTRSPTLYSNLDRYGAIPAPSTADPSATPLWKKVSRFNTAVWHDHRVHWMSTIDPPSVRNAPDKIHLINSWTLPLQIDGDPVTATGTLRWIPGASPWPWVALAVLVGSAVVFLGLRYDTRRVLQAVIPSVTIIYAVHTVGSRTAYAGTWQHILASSGESIVVLAVVLSAASIALRVTQRSGLTVAAVCICCFFGAAVVIAGGLSYISELWRSQLIFDGPSQLARFFVAIVLGVGTAVVVLALRFLKIVTTDVSK